MGILSFEQEWTRSNEKRVFMLRYFREALGVDEVRWEDFSTHNLVRIKEYIRTRVSCNTTVTYLAELKAFLNKFDGDGVVPCQKISAALKSKREPMQNVALTEDELRRLEGYYEKLMQREAHQAEKDVLTLFLIECYCGARGSDVEALTEDNIRNGRLTYISKKTRTVATMPAHRLLPALISRVPKKEYARAVKNRTIKRVCMKIGVTEPVTIMYHGKFATRPKYEYCGFHTARRTFASILSSKGVPVAEISQYMGHGDMTMTNRYIKVDTKKDSDAALEFFMG